MDPTYHHTPQPPPSSSRSAGGQHQFLQPAPPVSVASPSHVPLEYIPLNPAYHASLSPSPSSMSYAPKMSASPTRPVSHQPYPQSSPVSTTAAASALAPITVQISDHYFDTQSQVHAQQLQQHQQHASFHGHNSSQPAAQNTAAFASPTSNVTVLQANPAVNSGYTGKFKQSNCWTDFYYNSMNWRKKESWIVSLVGLVLIFAVLGATVLRSDSSDSGGGGGARGYSPSPTPSLSVLPSGARPSVSLSRSAFSTTTSSSSSSGSRPTPPPTPPPTTDPDPAKPCVPMECNRQYFSCTGGCERGDGQYLSCIQPCKGDFFCEADCRLGNSCFDGCDSKSAGCKDLC